MQYTYVGVNHQACLHHSHCLLLRVRARIIIVGCAQRRMSVCECVVCMCMCLCMWCMTQWVSWVCWWCLPKLQHGWRFSTNPASLEWLLILTTQFFPCSPLLYQKERRWERNGMHSFCACISHTEINLLISPWEASCKCSTQRPNVTHPVLPFFCLPLCHLFSFFLSFFLPFPSHIPPISLQRCTADVSSQEALCTSECHK